jgi:hypothetical protein
MLAILLLTVSPSAAQDERHTAAAAAEACAGNDSGITLPPGFCATVFADNIGHARQMVVAPNGVVYVNTWSGRYYRNDTPPAGGFLVALQDTTGDGHADVVATSVQRRDRTPVEPGSRCNGAVHARRTTASCYALPAGVAAPSAARGHRLGLPLTGDHPVPFRIVRRGTVRRPRLRDHLPGRNHLPNSPGHSAVRRTETRASIWRADANRTGSDSARRALRYRAATGKDRIRAPPAGCFATQHGRDQLRENWPRLYSTPDGRQRGRPNW